MVQPTDAEGLVEALSQVIRSFKQRAGQELGGQHAAVAVLWSAAERDSPRPSDLATQMRLDLSTVSRHVQALERDGYLRRAGDPADRRACRLEVTPRGREVLSQMRERRVADIGAATADWSPQDRQALIDLLSRLADGLRQDDPKHDETKHDETRPDDPKRDERRHGVRLHNTRHDTRTDDENANRRGDPAVLGGS